jgi:hypothetical protein
MEMPLPVSGIFLSLIGLNSRSLVTRGRAAICHLPAVQPQEVGNSFSIQRSRTLAPFRRLAKLRSVTVLHEKQPVDELPVSRGSSPQTTKPTADGVGQSPVRRILGHDSSHGEYSHACCHSVAPKGCHLVASQHCHPMA